MGCTDEDLNSRPRQAARTASVHLHHNAGLDGRGGSSYIDAVIFRDRDANGNGGAWDDASDGTLEERLYSCQNWRADVVALITDIGGMAEQVRYSPYGVPFGMPRGDVDSDGDADGSDVSAISFGTPGDVRQDIDLDGDVDIDDFNVVSSASGATLGRGVLSGGKDNSVGNALGYAGYVWSEYVSRNHTRHRVYDPESGRWSRRDPLGYVDGVNLHSYSGTISNVDPLGTSQIDILSRPVSKPTSLQSDDATLNTGVGFAQPCSRSIEKNVRTILTFHGASGLFGLGDSVCATLFGGNIGTNPPVPEFADTYARNWLGCMPDCWSRDTNSCLGAEDIRWNRIPGNTLVTNCPSSRQGVKCLNAEETPLSGTHPSVNIGNLDLLLRIPVFPYICHARWTYSCTIRKDAYWHGVCGGGGGGGGGGG